MPHLWFEDSQREAACMQVHSTKVLSSRQRWAVGMPGCQSVLVKGRQWAGAWECRQNALMCDEGGHVIEPYKAWTEAGTKDKVSP